MSASHWIARSLFSSSSRTAAYGNRALHYQHTDAEEPAIGDDALSSETAAMRLGPLSSDATAAVALTTAGLCCDCICYHCLARRYDQSS